VEQSQIDALRDLPVAQGLHFINGRWVEGETGARRDVISPIDGRVLTSIAAGTVADVDAAVGAARRCFEAGTWSRMAPAARKKIMLRIAEIIESRALELAVLGVRDNGTELAMAFKAEPSSAARTFRYYAESLDKIYGEIAPTPTDVLGLVHREAVGVVGAIVPWNMPLMIASWKLAPALALGNCVILKPAENATLALLKLAEICAEAGLPEGVLNVVTGQGSLVGKALASHGNVDVLAFTGSGSVGRQLMEYAARSNLKRVYLELGGKSPHIIFADTPDLDKVAQVAVHAAFRNSGQICVAGTRLLVEKSIHKALVEKVATRTQALKIGNPLDIKNEIGAIISKAQLDENIAHLERATREGAHLVTGGARILQETGGFYQRPAIFDEVRPEMALACEEIFGPLLAILPFEGEEEATRLANMTHYGLAAGVWTADLSRAHRMIRNVRAGVVHVNTYGGADMTVPLGGHKQSGNGHDKSLHALEKYTALKTAWIQL